MFRYEFLKESTCSDYHQFRDIINGMVNDDGWELFNVIGMHNEIVACLRKEVGDGSD